MGRVGAAHMDLGSWVMGGDGGILGTTDEVPRRVVKAIDTYRLQATGYKVLSTLRLDGFKG